MSEEDMKRQMCALLGSFETWASRIKKTTFATNVSFHQHASGEFSIRVTWNSPNGTPKSYEKKFSYDLVFGPPARRKQVPTVQRTPCSYMREFMQEVLTKRGVL